MHSKETVHIFFLFLKKRYKRKGGMKSSPYGPYELGYTRATMGITKSCNYVSKSESQKDFLSSN